jgi:hypothetical protein
MRIDGHGLLQVFVTEIFVKEIFVMNEPPAILLA